jgi:glycosyltransferase involved in cell wall biosynthesis
VRVAIDCRYIRERPSGIGVYVQALVDRLPELAPADTFIFWADTRARRPLSTAPNVTEQTIVAGPNSPLTIWFPRAFASFGKADLFHCPHNFLPRGVRGPAVVTVHDVMALDAPGMHRPGLERLKGLYFPQAVRRALRTAARVIVPTAAVADRALDWEPGAAPRLRVVPMAAHERFRPAADRSNADRRAAAMVGSDAPYLLVVGLGGANKRHDLAIRAFAAAAPPPWRLVVVMRLGSTRAIRTMAAASGVADRVVTLEAVDADGLVALMQAAGALIHPSVYEGFGIPPLEAMACGCPVVASDIPAVREVTAGAAVLTPPGDLPALAGAVRDLLASAGRRGELAAAGPARARVFSWERTARETIDVYRELR